MIVSASRRTDIPAFYSSWFMNRIRAGFCLVPSPFNPKQVSRIPLAPEDVDCIVFWTRDPRPLLPHLPVLDGEGYRYYFLITLLNNPRAIDPFAPSVKTSVDTFKRLSDKIGPRRVIWRYDPILLSTATEPRFHKEGFSLLAEKLRGSTTRSIISLATIYRKLRGRLSGLEQNGIRVREPEDREIADIMTSLAAAARENGMEILSCAQERSLNDFGILPGRCVDDLLIRDLFGIEVSHRKDPSQRKSCGCVESRDIGMYDSCRFGCVYCYATSDVARAKVNYSRHDPHGASLLPMPQTECAFPKPPKNAK
ncbi:MAG: DUF1848 domain-containing protein [Desulfobacteraceae bacterium]|nr:MAG: DUF1848 domain-containing protein [Desulfobacteraceae bacterium]